jgi:hypothetical protein
LPLKPSQTYSNIRNNFANTISMALTTNKKCSDPESYWQDEIQTYNCTSKISTTNGVQVTATY